MAERHLRESSVPESEWPGRRFRWSEQPEGGMWAAVIVEVERRGEQWMITRLDRLGRVPADIEFGFRVL